MRIAARPASTRAAETDPSGPPASLAAPTRELAIGLAPRAPRQASSKGQGGAAETGARALLGADTSPSCAALQGAKTTLLADNAAQNLALREARYRLPKYAPKDVPAPPKNAIAVPGVAQPNDYTCGPSSAAAIALYVGALDHVDVKQLTKGMHVTKDGADPKQLETFLNGLPGVKARIDDKMTFDDIANNFHAGKLSLVCYEAYLDPGYPKAADGKPDWPKIDDSGHYSVVVAADERGVWLMDPSANATKTGEMPRGFIPRKEFEARFYDGKVGSGISVDVGAVPSAARVLDDVRAVTYVP